MYKRIKYVIFAVMGILSLAACTPDSYSSPDGNNVPEAAKYADHISITVDPEERYAYLEFSPAEGVTPVWIIDGITYSSDFIFKKFYDHPGRHDVEVRVKNANGISLDAVNRSFDMVIAEPRWVDIESSDNLWNIAGATYTWRYLDDDMATSRTRPTVTTDGRSYTFTLPEATTQRQQAMMTFNTRLTVEDVTQEYDIIAQIESTTSFTAAVKLYDSTDGNNYFFDENVDLEAGKTVRFFVRQTTVPSPVTGTSGRRAKTVSLRFDFGTNPANTTITIKDIIFQKHS